MSEIVAGKGISRYISGVSERGLDVVYNPETGTYQTRPLAGGSASFVHFWSGAFFSYLTVGLTYVKNAEFETGDAFSNSQYLAGNLFWEPLPGRRVGLEYNWGRRENKNGEDGNANRVSFSIVYDF